DFSATAHTPYLIAAIGIVGIYGKWINTFRQRLGSLTVCGYFLASTVRASLVFFSRIEFR
ncbi:MAG: hypothetical protein ABFS02_14635, partial [Pseudomonadota bacterium]